MPWRSEYLYVGNRPTVFTDPSGLCDWYEWPCDPLSRAVGGFLEDAANTAAGINDAGNDVVGGTREFIWDFYTDPSVAEGILDSTAEWVENCSVIECAQDLVRFLISDFQRCNEAEGTGDTRAASRFCAKAIFGIIPFGKLGNLRRFDEIELKPYKDGKGHHLPAKKGLEGDPAFNLSDALAIPQSELDRLGVSHYDITGAQASLYSAFSKTGERLTWEVMIEIETQALVRAGVPRGPAQSAVERAVLHLQAMGVRGPTTIPWGR